MYLKSGNCMRSVLCIGVNWRNASAVMLYWSKVHRVLSNQMFFSGHHMAWSDQSMAMSETRKCPYVALLKRKWGPKIRIKSVVKKRLFCWNLQKKICFREWPQDKKNSSVIFFLCCSSKKCNSWSNFVLMACKMGVSPLIRSTFFSPSKNRVCNLQICLVGSYELFLCDLEVWEVFRHLIKF